MKFSGYLLNFNMAPLFSLYHKNAMDGNGEEGMGIIRKKDVHHGEFKMKNGTKCRNGLSGLETEVK